MFPCWGQNFHSYLFEDVWQGVEHEVLAYQYVPDDVTICRPSTKRKARMNGFHFQGIQFEVIKKAK